MENLSVLEKLHNSFDDKLLDSIKIISNCADAFGIRAFIIGGVVRDLLLEKPIYDIDIVVEGNAINFCRYGEENNFFQICRISEEFGTVKIRLKNNLEIDIASTRIEKYPTSGCLPVIEKLGCTLEEDIKRRDFTVNTLALCLNSKNFGTLIDLTGGITDINKKELKILHDKSFIDDPTRIIRALRFKYKLNFNLEKHTQKLCDDYLKNFNNNPICYERIKQVTKLAFSLNSAKLFDEFVFKNIYKLVSTSIRKCSGTKIFEAISTFLPKDNLSNLWLIYLACLINTQDAQKLNLNTKEMQIIVALENLLTQNPNFQNNFEIYNFFKQSPIESIICYISLTNSTAAKCYLTKLKNIKTDLNAKALIQLGYTEGKLIGYTLEKLLEAKLNKKNFSKNDEIQLAKKILLDF